MRAHPFLKPLVSLLAALGAASASALVADSSSIIQKPIGAQRAIRPIEILDISTGESRNCTGTFISPTTLLTAGHCLRWVTPEKLQLRDTQSGAVTDNGIFLWTSDHRFDIALVEFSEPVYRGSNFFRLSFKEPSPQDLIWIFGSGDSRISSDDSSHEQATLRAGTPEVTSILPLQISVVGSPGINAGDSGGPAITNKGLIVGVISRSFRKVGLDRDSGMSVTAEQLMQGNFPGTLARTASDASDESREAFTRFYLDAIESGFGLPVRSCECTAPSGNRVRFLVPDGASSRPICEIFVTAAAPRGCALQSPARTRAASALNALPKTLDIPLFR